MSKQYRRNFCNSWFLGLLSFCLQILLATVLHCQEFHSLGTTFHPLPAEAFTYTNKQCICVCLADVFHCKMPLLHSSWWCFRPFHIDSDICCSKFTCISLILTSTMANILLWLRANPFLDCSLYLKWLQLFHSFYYWRGISVSTCSFIGSRYTRWNIIYLKSGILMHLKWYLFLFNLLMAYIHYLSKGSAVMSSISIIPYTIKMQSRHNHTLPLGLGTTKKLLYHLAISATDSGASICFSCSLILFKWLLRVHMLYTLRTHHMVWHHP